jgi:hypothetical protein
MLSRVNPYGTLVLSSSEMDQFISEIEIEFSRVADLEVKELLKSALRLARECQVDGEMQLRLDGD